MLQVWIATQFNHKNKVMMHGIFTLEQKPYIHSMAESIIHLQRYARKKMTICRLCIF
jgi:hypothetical protein